MPLVGIRPNSSEVEDFLATKMPMLRAALKRTISRLSGFPQSDVIITLHTCDVRDADPDASDFVVFADTNPNEEVEEVADELRDAIANAFVAFGATDGKTAEFWPRFLPGSWCLIKDSDVEYRVDHTLQ